MRKQGRKNADYMPGKWQQFSVMAQKDLKLADFLFHHRMRCTFDWEVTRVQKDTGHLLAEQNRLEDNYKDLDMITKVNKADMASMVDVIKEYLRLHHGVMRTHLAQVIRKTIVV